MKQILKKILPPFIKLPLYEYKRQRYCINKYKNEELNNFGNYYSLNAFDYYKCVFIHIPKAAGVSINKTLFGNLGGGHYTYKDYQNIYLSRTLKKYFKFTIIRNPYDRLYSAYSFLKKGGFDKKDKKWAEKNLNYIHSYEQFVKEWVNLENIYKKNHFIPQVEYLISKDGEIDIDYIGHVESIEMDFKIICDKLGIKRNLKHVNKTVKKRMPNVDNEMRNIIEIVYKKDFEMLNF